MDFFDIDVIMPDVAMINGAPFRYIRSKEDVATIRQGRQQAQQAEQLVQALPGMAAMAKAASPEGTSQLPGQPA